MVVAVRYFVDFEIVLAVVTVSVAYVPVIVTDHFVVVVGVLHRFDIVDAEVILVLGWSNGGL